MRSHYFFLLVCLFVCLDCFRSAGLRILKGHITYIRFHSGSDPEPRATRAVASLGCNRLQDDHRHHCRSGKEHRNNATHTHSLCHRQALGSAICLMQPMIGRSTPSPIYCTPVLHACAIAHAFGVCAFRELTRLRSPRPPQEIKYHAPCTHTPSALLPCGDAPDPSASGDCCDARVFPMYVFLI